LLLAVIVIAVGGATWPTNDVRMDVRYIVRAIAEETFGVVFENMNWNYNSAWKAYPSAIISSFPPSSRTLLFYDNSDIPRMRLKKQQENFINFPCFGIAYRTARSKDHLGIYLYAFSMMHLTLA